MHNVEALTTKENLLAYGDHLNEIRTVLAAAGLTLLTLAPEMGAHVDEAAMHATGLYCGEILKPVIERIDRELAEVCEKLDKAEGDTTALEALFSQAAAEKDTRPGEGGYL